ncbi:hypothetical protein NMY22_g10652 [Coprinellus aureogranulatus]|nr:hypothetical protein NMY22_g10652 [Coprinellus aureogranulatus]
MSTNDTTIRTDDVVILVMGRVGSGRSTFINTLFPSLNREVGDSGCLLPCTTEVEHTVIEASTLSKSVGSRKDYRLVLVDTPGLDPSDGSDSAVMKQISDWANARLPDGGCRGGVVFLYDISVDRLQAGTEIGTLSKAFNISSQSKQLIIVTSKWNSLVDRTQGYRRHESLINQLDKTSRGARFHKLEQDADAWEVMRDFLSQLGKAPKVNFGKTFNEMKAEHKAEEKKKRSAFRKFLSSLAFWSLFAMALHGISPLRELSIFEGDTLDMYAPSDQTRHEGQLETLTLERTMACPHNASWSTPSDPALTQSTSPAGTLNQSYFFQSYLAEDNSSPSPTLARESEPLQAHSTPLGAYCYVPTPTSLGNPKGAVAHDGESLKVSSSLQNLPAGSIDSNEAHSPKVVTSSPESIDKLEGRKSEPEVAKHALERDKDAASKGRVDTAGKNVTAVDDELRPIEVTRLVTTENEKLLRLERILAEDVIGQDDAIKAVANAVRLSRSGLSGPNRPTASFLMVGPPGTGKTLVAKTLATVLFNSSDALVRIDASEYSEKHSISKLIGSAPGHIDHDQGGQLTEFVRRKPYSIILLDEIEKACKEFVALFLQILGDGYLTDGHGHVVDMKNTIIIMTSNLGASFLHDMPEGPILSKTRTLVIDAITSHFPPEFIDSIDDIIIFRALSPEDIRKIVEIRIKEVEERLADKKIKLDLDIAARHFLLASSYSPQYGARPLHRAIQAELLNPLSVLLLSGGVLPNETVRVAFNGPYNCLDVIPNHPLTTENMDLGQDMDVEEEDED